MYEVKKVKLCNIYIDNVRMDEVIDKIDQLISLRKKTFVVTPNVDHIVQLSKDKEFQIAYRRADIVLADGMPIIWLSKLLGTPLVERVSGADLVPNLFKLASKKNYKVFILGSSISVLESLEKKIKSSSNPFILNYYSPYFGFENDQKENDKILKLINNYKPDILLVSLGAPKGEKWIYKHLDLIDTAFVAQVGAAIDFVAGSKKRAPKWMQKIGLEWFYRFLQEPVRLFKRYFIRDAKFIMIAMKELLKRKY